MDIPSEPESEFVVLWPGHSKPIHHCDSPCLTRFATVIEVWPRPEREGELKAALELVPTPADLTPWIMRLPEFVCHLCQGKPVFGVYLYQINSLDSAGYTLFCPKEFVVEAMDKMAALSGVQTGELRQREVIHLAKTVLGVDIAPMQVTNCRSGVYDVVAVWESHAPAECLAAKDILKSYGELINQWREEASSFKVQAEMWQAMEPEIDTAIRRLCQNRRRGVALGVFHGIPSICLDCAPVGLEINRCDAVCWRHPIVFGTLKRLFEPFGLEVDDGQLATCLQMFSPIIESMMKESFLVNDYTAPLDREKLINGGPGFGNGVPFTVSGLVGQHYLISETDVDRRDTNAAVELLQVMLRESIRTGWLHHFHVDLAYGRFNLDPRSATEITEVAAWVQALHERFPALWFFLDPDSISWVYPAIFPDSLTKGMVHFEPHNYASLCVRATSAAVEQLRACNCRPELLDNLLYQAAIVKNIAAANSFPNTRAAINSQFEAFLAQTDIPKDLLGLIGAVERELVLSWVLENAAASYSDGHDHTGATTISFANGYPDSYFVFKFFPCATPLAKDTYQRFGGYRKLLEQLMYSDELLRLRNERGIEMLVHIVVCYESFLKYSFHLSFLPWQDKESAYTAPAFRECK
ncbi:MAG: hypothetical protein ABFD11_05180 [Christensenella sp.]